MGKSIIGVGLFAMPYTFSCVGLFFGIIFLISMGYLITISLRLLLKIHRITTIRLEKPIVMYDEIVVSILKNTNENIPTIFLDLAKYFTNIILIFYYVDIGAVCVDFICDILRTISEIEETKYPDYFTFIFFPFFMLINLSEDLHKMIFNSMVGNIFILNATAIGLAYSFQKDNSEDWKIVSKELVYYPRFFGFVFCSLSSPGLILAIEHSTQKLWNYNKLYGILDQCMTIIVGIHLIVGIVGYIKWGPNVSENFIHNIHKDRDGYTLTALVTQAAAIYFTYGLLSYVPINIVLRQYILPLIETKLRKGT
ncbi:proton-coupled amino acid transporter 2-like, partial [Vespula squamosa]